MSDFLFFKESPSEHWETICGSKDLQNVRVVGLDGKGWTSELLLASVSPWIRELMSSLPPYSDHCVILPDISWKDISGFFQSQALLNSLLQSQQSWEESDDLGNLLKIPLGGQQQDDLLSHMHKLVTTNVDEFDEYIQHDKTISLNDDIKNEEIYSQSIGNCMKQEEFLEKAPVTNTALRSTDVALYKESKVKCEECGVFLPSEKRLKNHIKYKRCNKKFQKIGRPKRPRNKTKYSERMISRFKNDPNVDLDSYNFDGIEGIIVSCCDECKKKCISPEHLKQHKDKVHPIFYSCDYCEYTAHGQRQLKIHIHEIHIDIISSCDMCDKKYTKPNDVRRHKRKIHEGVRYPCDRCDFKAKDTKNLKGHKDAIHEKITVSCDMCDKVYTNPRNLQQHQASEHKGIFYLCDQCDYKGSQRRNLQRHIDKVHEGIFFQCDQCEYRYTLKSTLNSHIKKHHTGLETQ